ncbi:heavy-metal-associated domain protein [Rhodococcus sp. MTM3W5.2]|nr:heavy-metal-associated domain protein [Rhodococcus sp. MTM3W5.2]
MTTEYLAPETTGTASIELAIGGMTCASCAARIEKRLNKMEGVTATVNYATEKAKVVFDPAVTSADLVAEVEKAGYSATVPQPPSTDRDAAAGAEPEDEQSRALAALRTRLIVSAILSVPVIAMAMIPALQFTNWQWLSLTLAAPVIVWAGLPFHKATWANLKHGAATMDTLITIGTGSAFLWSLYALFFGTAGKPGMTHPFSLTIGRTDGAANIYLEVAAGVITFVLAGRYFEQRSKRRAGAAMRALFELGPRRSRCSAAVSRPAFRQRNSRSATCSLCDRERRSPPTARSSRADQRWTCRC